MAQLSCIGSSWPLLNPPFGGSKHIPPVLVTTTSFAKQLAAVVGIPLGLVLSGFSLPPPTVLKMTWQVKISEVSEATKSLLLKTKTTISQRTLRILAQTRVPSVCSNHSGLSFKVSTLANFKSKECSSANSLLRPLHLSNSFQISWKDCLSILGEISNSILRIISASIPTSISAYQKTAPSGPRDDHWSNQKKRCTYHVSLITLILLLKKRGGGKSFHTKTALKHKIHTPIFVFELLVESLGWRYQGTCIWNSCAPGIAKSLPCCCIL